MSITIPGVSDFEHEHLVATDVGVASLRRVLGGIAQSVERGEVPLGISAETPAPKIRAISGTLAPGEHWRDLVPEHRAPGKKGGMD